MAYDARKETGETILRFVEGRERDDWEWGEYLVIKESDPYLETVRLRCLAIPETYPPESETEFCSEAGKRELRKIAIEVLGAEPRS